MDAKNNQGNKDEIGMDRSLLSDVANDFHEFNKKQFSIDVQSASKSQLTETINKLIAECERLNSVAKKKSTILAMKNAEIEKLNLEKKQQMEGAGSSGNSTSGLQRQIFSLSQDVKSKEVEIQYLEAQLQKKEEDNTKLKKETEKMLLEQQIKFSQSVISGAPGKDSAKKQSKSGAGLPDEGPEQTPEYFQKIIRELNQKVDFYKKKNQQLENPENLDIIVFEAFNNNLKERLKFIQKIHNWQKLGDKVNGREHGYMNNDSFHDVRLEDGELAHEHFNSNKSELQKIMENAYFPVVDCHEHDNQYERLDVAIKMEHDKLQDKILVELVTLQQMMHVLGLVDDDEEEDNGTPGQFGDGKSDKFAAEHKITTEQRHVIGGLMKRLLNQLPAKIPNTEIRSNDFQVKISNLYLLLQKRVSMKKIFEISMDISMRKTYEDINIITERIMTAILDYDEYCEHQEKQAVQPKVSTQNVFNHFAQRILDKQKNLKGKNMGQNRLSSPINKFMKPNAMRQSQEGFSPNDRIGNQIGSKGDVKF